MSLPSVVVGALRSICRERGQVRNDSESIRCARIHRVVSRARVRRADRQRLADAERFQQLPRLGALLFTVHDSGQLSIWPLVLLPRTRLVSAPI